MDIKHTISLQDQELFWVCTLFRRRSQSQCEGTALCLANHIGIASEHSDALIHMIQGHQSHRSGLTEL